ncbi:hypothetical protein [Paenibacillus sp. FSL R7-0337]|uniref:hypothetical protein n=1 Tax=unclassified Paenibacillus TaxID=185978 RepID=UPI00096DF05A|nr:hypothetical protein [Paenibacillus sp. FSL R7-0337]OMF99483.1 hypothetical protein BK147_07910 [Paenibacillus sp. FSL R7-0337]
MKSLACPNISTGIYNFPKELACKTALEAVVHYVRAKSPAELPLRQIDFVCFEHENAGLYEAMLGNYS